MTILIRKPGMLTTVQDLGRYGARRFGINPSGVMDRSTTRVLNTVLGNDEQSAVLEMHFPAPEIEFESDTLFALGGADFGAELDGHDLPNCHTAFAKRGGLLRFTRRGSGQRAYLAIRGGVRVEKWLASSSTNMAAESGGFHGRRLAAGDRIECDASSEEVRVGIGPSLSTVPRGPVRIRTVAGNEFGLLTAISERDFLDGSFVVTPGCDRMGYRLAGPPLHLLHAHEMISSGVSFGTIQLLPDGQLIVLMADHQTSGGYPRIANVISTDLPVLAQCGPGDSVGFELVSIEAAENLGMEFERELNYLRVGCRFQRQNADG